jgi:hypothetical protein
VAPALLITIVSGFVAFVAGILQKTRERKPRHKKRRAFMKTKILFATLLMLALFTRATHRRWHKAKLDQFFDRLAEKNKAMGSLTIAKDGKVIYTRAIGYSQINGTAKKP